MLKSDHATHLRSEAVSRPKSRSDITLTACSKLTSYLWQEEGREEGQEEWTLSQATQRAKLRLYPSTVELWLGLLVSGIAASLTKTRAMLGTSASRCIKWKNVIHH